MVRFPQLAVVSPRLEAVSSSNCRPIKWRRSKSAFWLNQAAYVDRLLLSG